MFHQMSTKNIQVTKKNEIKRVLWFINNAEDTDFTNSEKTVLLFARISNLCIQSTGPGFVLHSSGRCQIPVDSPS